VQLLRFRGFFEEVPYSGNVWCLAYDIFYPETSSLISNLENTMCKFYVLEASSRIFLLVEMTADKPLPLSTATNANGFLVIRCLRL
jgi:hypothetical protein